MYEDVIIRECTNNTYFSCSFINSTLKSYTRIPLALCMSIYFAMPLEKDGARSQFMDMLRVWPDFPSPTQRNTEASKQMEYTACFLASTAGNASAPRAVVVGWLLNVPATCECISGTDLLGQFYVLPH